jgi:type IV fimbrial biogenesis protein FimT
MKILAPVWRAPRARGFTMTELMAVLVIAAILLGIGVTGFRHLIHNQKIIVTVSDFFAAVNLTRSEAIERGTRIDLVPAGDGTDWAKGWVVLIDRNGNQKADAGDQVIYLHGPAPDGITIKSAFTDSKVQYLAYNGTGRTRTNANSQAPQAGSWLFAIDQQERKIVVNFLGRPRVCNPQTDPATC